MVKFKFNYQPNSLAYQPQESEVWYEITETFEGNFGSQGFQLIDGWITFTVYEKKIRVFYKQIHPGPDPEDFWEPQQVAYFRKDLPKTAEIIFTFTEADQVEKVGKVWIRKGGQHG